MLFKVPWNTCTDKLGYWFPQALYLNDPMWAEPNMHTLNRLSFTRNLLWWFLSCFCTSCCFGLRCFNEGFVSCKIIKININDYCCDLEAVNDFDFLLKFPGMFLNKLGLTLVPNIDNTEEMDENNYFRQSRTNAWFFFPHGIFLSCTGILLFMCVYVIHITESYKVNVK